MEMCKPYQPQVYLAAPLFTPHQKWVIAQVRQVMEDVGFNVFSPLDESKHIWNGRAPAECGPEERKAVMQMNKDGVGSSDVVFAWLGGWEPWRDMKMQLSEVGLHTGSVGVTISDGTLKRLIPSLPDTGVVWEMGYANALGIQTLAYLHEGEGDRNFNLMLSETVDAVARGLVELHNALKVAKDGALRDAELADLASEGAEFNG